MARRFGRGIEPAGEMLAADLFARIGLSGEFLKLRETRALFRGEQYIPGTVIDRGSLRQWEDGGREDAFARARRRVAELVAAYHRPSLGAERERALLDVIRREAERGGLSSLPGL
jgi:trimethylamine:corrinoid methyltransferase-like protein